MRILAIRGQNLASLSEPFEIDLTIEPLAGTGLFAITGDTGAGKSTILDALCLALFNNYPRASDKRNETVRDASAEDIQASDPRNILRRGAGEGFAEVDFIGMDGIEYRAGWAVRRARGRATGKLQNVDRKLERRDGSAAIATGTREVLEAVIERSGFTFDEFRRSVLLAQGEFDAFLLADEGRRADLLEKITGTEIYSLISMRVFEETSERQRALDAIVQHRDAIGVVSDAARDAWLAEQEQKSRDAIAESAECERLGAMLKRADDIAKARDSLAVVGAALDESQAAWDAARNDRAHLERLAAVAPLRPKADAVADRQKDRQTVDETVARLFGEMSAAETAHIEAQTVVNLRQVEARSAEAEMVRFEPEWQQAVSLDQQIATARAERDKADIANQEARELAARLGEEMAQIRDRRLDAERRQSETRRALESRAAHARLKDEAARIAQLFDARAELSRRVAVEQKSLSDVTRHETTAVESRTAADERLAARKTESRSLAGQLSERRSALASIDLAALTGRDGNLRRLEDVLSKSIEAARRRDSAREGEARARVEAVSANRDRDDEVKRLDAAERVHDEVSAARAETVRMVDLADATFSAQAAHLRTCLIDGESCPVCGAKQHPFNESSSVGSELARVIRQRRDELDEAIAKATGEIMAAKVAIASAKARHDLAVRAAANEAEKAAEAVRGLVHLVTQAVGQHAALGLSLSLGEAPEGTTMDAFKAGAGLVAQERHAIAGPREKAETLRRECDDLQRRLDALAEAIEAKAAEAEAEGKALAALQSDKSRLAATCKALGEQIADNLAEIVPHLACANLTSDLEWDANGARRQLETLAEEYSFLITERDRLADELRSLDLEIKGGQARHDATASDSTNAAGAATERARHLEQLEQQRTGLLGGAPTEQHRAGFQASAARARNDLDAASKQKAAADVELARLKAEQRSAVATAEQSATRLAEAISAFGAAVAGLGLSEPETRTLLAVSETEHRALSERVDKLRKAHESAENTHSTRQKDLDALLTSGEPLSGSEVEAARQQLAERSAALQTLRDRLTIIRNDLERDQEARNRAADIGTQIAQKERELGVWRDVDAAIGQKDGAKFRRFAQGVTLGQLVTLANEQLRALNPRYALRRGAISNLALDVVDRDMGEEVRSPRSLSGGERFLVSLALALALSGLEGRQSFVDTLFIDEGFGSLDRETLDVAIDALESLQGQGRKVGVITHVPAMMERIGVQVRVEKRGSGRSIVRVRNGITDAAGLLHGAARRTGGALSNNRAGSC